MRGAGRCQEGAAGCPRLGRGKGFACDIARTKGENGRGAQTPGERTQTRSQGLGSPLCRTGLRDRPGLTPPEILERAATDMERLIKLSSILTELRNGRRQGKYELSGGRWSLAASALGAAGADETTSPEPTQGSEPGEGETKGTPGLNL